MDDHQAISTDDKIFDVFEGCLMCGEPFGEGFVAVFVGEWGEYGSEFG